MRAEETLPRNVTKGKGNKGRAHCRSKDGSKAATSLGAGPSNDHGEAENSFKSQGRGKGTLGSRNASRRT